MILGEMCVLSLIYIYVAVCRFCVVHCLIICFWFLFSNCFVYFNILFMLSCFVCLFSILCILCFCIVLCIIVSSFVYSCLFPFFMQVY